jgi:hypothetical protein
LRSSRRNRFEAHLYKRVNSRRRATLCQVRCCTPPWTCLGDACRAQPLTEAEAIILRATDGFPDWDYVPLDESAPFEYKASDRGCLKGCLVALDYSAPALLEDVVNPGTIDWSTESFRIPVFAPLHRHADRRWSEIPHLCNDFQKWG